MSRSSRESWRIELGRRSVELWSTVRGESAWHLHGSVETTAVATPGAGEAAHHDALLALLQARVPRGAAVATVIRDECARYAVVDPPVNARRPADIRFVAAARLDALYGDIDDGWIVEADWSATRRFLACAVPAAMPSAVARGLASAGLRDAGMTTEFVAAWNLHCKRMRTPAAWVVHAGREAMVLAACAGAGVEQVAALRFDVPPTASDAIAEVRRCALRWGLPEPECAYLFGPGFADAAAQDDGTGALVRWQSRAEAAATGVGS